MQILWQLFEYINTIFQDFWVCYFICAFLGLDFTARRGKTTLVIGSIGFTIIVIVANHMTIYEGIYGAIYTIMFFVLTLFIPNCSILKKLFVSILTNVILVSVNALVTTCMSAALGDYVEQIYSQQTLSRFVMILIVQMLLIYVFGLILKLAEDTQMHFKIKEWTLVLSVFAVSFISLVFIHMTLVNNNFRQEITLSLFVAELGIIIVNVVCFYMTKALSKSNAEAVEAKSRQQQQEYRIQYADTVQRQYEETRRIRHDMKQNIAALYALHKEGKYNEAQDYLKKYETSLNTIDALIDVGNDSLNAILNYKMSIARENNIEIICSCSKGISGIDELDLCALLGNMLDNAIEATEKCPLGDRVILCKLTDDEVKLIVKVENSILSPILSNNNQLKTTKQNKGAHGFGIKTIRSIAEKYNGNADFYEEGKNFVCSVVMYK